MIQYGYNVIPVNPTTAEILERKSYSEVSDISGQVDIVDIFRRSEDVPSVIDDIINKKGEKGIKVIWIQSGIYNKMLREKQRKME